MTSRQVFGLIFLVCAGLLGVAFYMELVMGLEPCPLCWLQRFGFMGAGLVSLLAVIHGPAGLGVRIYGLLLTRNRWRWSRRRRPPALVAESARRPGAGLRPVCGLPA